ncbi:MAG TPA: DUF302 domain-containing protein [Thermoanaerobaculia bacterium]
MQTTAYGIRRIVDRPYDDTVASTRAALAAEGFGVLMEIDLREKLKEKLGVDFKRYVILGACNPPLAYKALQEEPDLGLLLPCNVIVYEQSAGRCVVAAIDAGSMLTITGNDKLADVARQVGEKLERVIASV